MKLAETTMESGYSFQQELLLQALERQALTGRLMTNQELPDFLLSLKLCLILLMIRKHLKLVKIYIDIF